MTAESNRRGTGIEEREERTNATRIETEKETETDSENNPFSLENQKEVEETAHATVVMMQSPNTQHAKSPIPHSTPIAPKDLTLPNQ